MENADLKKLQLILLVLVFLICCIQKGTGFTTYPTVSTTCACSSTNIDFNISLAAQESIFGNRNYFFGTGKIAESNGTNFIPVRNYSSRLTTYGTYGISLNNVTIADAGIYTYGITLMPTGKPFTATANLSVRVAPSSGCSVSGILSNSTVTCTVNTSSGNCGTPPLNAYWVNFTTRSNQFECTGEGIYQCCATSDALNCYSGSPNDFCIPFHCTRETSFIPPSSDHCPHKLRLGLGLGLGIPYIAYNIIIVIMLSIGDPSPLKLGLGLGLGLGISFVICIICIVILVRKADQTALKLGLGLGLGLGIPVAICISIIIVILVKKDKKKSETSSHPALTPEEVALQME